MYKFAIIGGSGVYNAAMLTEAMEGRVDTPYGAVNYIGGKMEGEKVVFITRHSSNHSIPPHKINYPANIWALKKLGVKKIIATAAVGSIDKKISTGQFVIVDQFLDFTKSRASTFFNGEDGKVLHVDVSEPYCPDLRSKILSVTKEMHLPTHSTGVYVCTEGPRFETPAEIKMFSQLGGSVIGMTGVPEAVLAREAEMCYASINMITNMAAGISKTQLTTQEVFDVVATMNDSLQKLLKQTIVKYKSTAEEVCSCHSAAAEVGGFKI